MKVLLTGASGMVGRNILEHQLASEFEFLTPSSKELNLLNSNDVSDYVKKKQPQIIIHCAGVVGGIQTNIKSPIRFLVENAEMGKNILLASNLSPNTRVINLGSSCMYPKDSRGLLKEEEILSGPLEPTNEGYALAKIMTMKLGLYINREKLEKRIVTMIPCNLYGRWDKFGEANSHMLPAAIRKIHSAIQENSESVVIWGTGNARREFMYCADLADAIFFTIKEWKQLPEFFNVGLGFDYSINDYYKTISNVLGYKGSYRHDLDKPEGMRQKVVDVSRLEAFGWKAKIGLELGISNTYKYFLEAQKR